MPTRCWQRWVEFSGSNNAIAPISYSHCYFLWYSGAIQRTAAAFLVAGRRAVFSACLWGGDERELIVVDIETQNFMRPAAVTYDHIVQKNQDPFAEGLLERLNAGEEYLKLGDFTTYDRPSVHPASRSVSKRSKALSPSSGCLRKTAKC